MPIQKDAIILGATYGVRYQCLAPNDDGGFSREELTPVSASVQLYIVQTGEYAEFADGDDTVTIEEDIVSFIVKSDYLTVAGDYKLFVAVDFPDGQTVVDERVFKVRERS